MTLDEDQQAMQLACIAAKEAEDLKELEDRTHTEAAKGEIKVKEEPKEIATDQRVKPPQSMEPATPTLETDRKEFTVSSTPTDPTQSASASSSSKSLK